MVMFLAEGSDGPPSNGTCEGFFRVFGEVGIVAKGSKGEIEIVCVFKDPNGLCLHWAAWGLCQSRVMKGYNRRKEELTLCNGNPPWFQTTILVQTT